MIDQLIKEFDEGLLALDCEKSIYTMLKDLTNDIESDEQLNELIDKQKELQLIILNFERMKKPGFVKKYKEELEVVDLTLLKNEKLMKLKELYQLVELDKQLIKNELKLLNLE